MQHVRVSAIYCCIISFFPCSLTALTGLFLFFISSLLQLRHQTQFRAKSQGVYCQRLIWDDQYLDHNWQTPWDTHNYYLNSTPLLWGYFAKRSVATLGNDFVRRYTLHYWFESLENSSQQQTCSLMYSQCILAISQFHHLVALWHPCILSCHIHLRTLAWMWIMDAENIVNYSMVQPDMHEESWLVGGFSPSEKYEFVNWDDDIPNIWENDPVMFQSPPTWWGNYGETSIETSSGFWGSHRGGEEQALPCANQWPA